MKIMKKFLHMNPLWILMVLIKNKKKIMIILILLF